DNCLAATWWGQSLTTSRVSTQLNADRKLRTDLRAWHGGAVWPGKKAHLTIFGAEPNLASTGIKVESSFFADFGLTIARRDNLDADFRRFWKAELVAQLKQSFCGSPGHVGCLYAVSRRNRALRQNVALGEKVPKQLRNLGLKGAMTRSRGWTHNGVTVAIGFN